MTVMQLRDMDPWELEVLLWVIFVCVLRSALFVSDLWISPRWYIHRFSMWRRVLGTVAL
jgi:hypothetical protein